MYKREDIARFLSQGTAEVTFTKVDGSVRKMVCTIAPHLIPDDKKIKVTEPFVPAPANTPIPGYLRVFDVEKRDWRSFIVANVTDITLGQDL
jgi:hypothetical protein